jgi:flagellar biosynthetic protein FliR
MSPLESFLVSRFMVFSLVLARTSGLVLTAPLFSSLGLPRQVRAFLAVAMALLVTPIYLDTSMPPVENLGRYAHLMINEVAVGLLLGMGMNILFSGIMVAGQIVSQMSGLSLADVFNPGFDENASVFSQLFYFLVLAVFVAVGGHRIMTAALLDTFAWAPPGHAMLGETFVEALTSVMTQSFALGLRAAAPLLIALFLSTLVLGLVSRTLPQINIIAVGFGLNSLLTLAIMILSVGTVAWTFQQPVVDVLGQLQEALVQ